MRRTLTAIFAASALLACNGDLIGPSESAYADSETGVFGSGDAAAIAAIGILGGDEDNFGFGDNPVPCARFNNAVDVVDRGILDRAFWRSQETYSIDLSELPGWAEGLVIDSVHLSLREWASAGVTVVNVAVPGLPTWSIPRAALSRCATPKIHTLHLDASDAATVQELGVVPLTVSYGGGVWDIFAIDYFRVTIFIGEESLTTAEVEATPPTAHAGDDQVVECTGHEDGTEVTLDGTGSFHDDGEIVLYEWLDADGAVIATGATPTIALSHATHTLTLRVTDADGLTDEDTVEIVVEDTTAPDLELAVTPDELWPPNGKHHAISVNAVATDICALEDELVLTAHVVSSEPEAEGADGDGTAGDIRVTRADGTVLVSSADQPTVTFDPRTDKLEVRAARIGDGEGRVYTITVTATDPSGNAADAAATVTVAHDQRDSEGKGDDGKGDDGKGDDGKGDDGKGDNGKGDNGKGDNGKGDNGKGNNGKGGNGK